MKELTLLEAIDHVTEQEKPVREFYKPRPTFRTSRAWFKNIKRELTAQFSGKPFHQAIVRALQRNGRGQVVISANALDWAINSDAQLRAVESLPDEKCDEIMSEVRAALDARLNPQEGQ